MSSEIQFAAVSAYEIPTDSPESDGTLQWDSTTVVVVEVRCDGATGLGYSYADASAARLIADKLKSRVEGLDPMNVPQAYQTMRRAARNLGQAGITAMAISAVDAALWDLKARLLGVSLVKLLGQVRESTPIYGSGGFTSYSVERLREQLGGWVAQGIPRVKMKVGRHPAEDVNRVRAAREAIGPDAALYVDGNGAYDRKQALELAHRFAEYGVSWFEQPVNHEDWDGLRLLRDRGPRDMEITSGEYGYTLNHFHRLIAADAIDVVQADATRCGGVSGFLGVGALCEAAHVPLSAHTAPSLHAPPCCAVENARNIEYFHDHARIESIIFDGALKPDGGALRPDPDQPGMGIALQRQDAEPYLAWREEY
jgi:L-alanine-DL-glutamate epimerase-like enolase superfamily enzyme